MKFTIILLCHMLIFSLFLYSQNKLSADIGCGYYLSNSENSLLIMRDNNYTTYLLYGISFRKENIFGNEFEVGYSYSSIKKENIIRFVWYDPSPAALNDTSWGDISIQSHSFDFDYIGRISNYFSYGLGPSFEIINRTFKVNFPPSEELISLNDRLASSALGVNAFIDFSYPLWEGNNSLFITSEIKFRYTHSIWFDKGNRNLDNYSQEFLTGQVSAGLGYSF